MINIEGVQHIIAPKAIQPAETIHPAEAQTGAMGVSDVVEISTGAILASKVQDIPEIRTELVERVKAEIAAGAYETPERIDAAISRLIDEMFPFS